MKNSTINNVCVNIVRVVINHDLLSFRLSAVFIIMLNYVELFQ